MRSRFEHLRHVKINDALEAFENWLIDDRGFQSAVEHDALAVPATEFLDEFIDDFGYDGSRGRLTTHAKRIGKVSDIEQYIEDEDD